ncbi:T9SS type A sorting domain-containing protein [Hymenobacter ruricola]|uniref:T9SS type A sorting domain-containing protein n=1 Tax=Hymenobacter ruricola TaxID=2791023 RepID=A0ABS0I2T4_9BACT|nr:T9SS type A sorting domain-containing protein [Hymenobacter ruricola]MBF9220874.1 T9SS type A sorting domain-containing protein [Hymenobacter ruricola]
MKKLLLLFALTGSFAAQAQVVTVSAGTSLNIYLPLNQFNAYGAYEVVYLQNSLNQAGTITRLAFEKNDGTDLRAIDGVSIYLKTTAAALSTNATIDSTGYQRVFKGSFTNATTSGYQEIQLDQPFVYTNTANLSLLLIRRNGQNVAAASNGPRARWLYGLNTAGISRRYDGGAPITSTTAFQSSNVLANLRLTFSTGTATRTLTLATCSRLFPVPATSSVSLDAAGLTGPLTYFITDALGRTVQAPAALPPTTDSQYQFDISQLHAGLYHLHLTHGTSQEVMPLVRE